jgi:excisionase family DNA binding protein
MIFDNDNDMVMTIKDVMNTLKIGRVSTYKLIQNGELKAAKIAGKYLTTKAAIYEYLNKAILSAGFEDQKAPCYNSQDCLNGAREIPGAERSSYFISAERNRT